MQCKIAMQSHLNNWALPSFIGFLALFSALQTFVFCIAKKEAFNMKEFVASCYKLKNSERRNCSKLLQIKN